MGERKGRRRKGDLPRRIRERLREYVLDYCGANQTKFARRIGVPRTTVTGWLSVARLHTPDAEQLAALAGQGNVNLNWLFLGTPPRLRGAPVHGGYVPALLRATIAAELAAEFGSSGAGTELSQAVLPEADELFDQVLNVYRSWAQVFVRTRALTHVGAAAVAADSKGSVASPPEPD